MYLIDEGRTGDRGEIFGIQEGGTTIEVNSTGHQGWGSSLNFLQMSQRFVFCKKIHVVTHLSRNKLNATVRGTAWYSLATRDLVIGGGVGGGVWEGCFTVRVTVIVSMTVPISKKQKKVGMKYLAKILGGSSL